MLTGGVSSSLSLSDSGFADMLENTPSVGTGNVAGCEEFAAFEEEDAEGLSGIDMIVFSCCCHGLNKRCDSAVESSIDSSNVSSRSTRCWFRVGDVERKEGGGEDVVILLLSLSLLLFSWCCSCCRVK